MVTGVRVVPQNEKLKQCERSQQVTFNTTQSQGPGPAAGLHLCLQKERVTPALWGGVSITSGDDVPRAQGTRTTPGWRPLALTITEHFLVVRDPRASSSPLALR